MEELLAGLLDAYDENSLRRMVRIQLDEPLDAIAGGRDLSELVFNLIGWAERTGRVAELIGKAHAYNPGNARLGAFARSLPGIPVLPPAGEMRPAAPIAFDWVAVPAGEFGMGSDKAKDAQAHDNETPQHTLRLPDYRIARVPVTVAQFAAFVAATHHQTTAEEQGSARSWTGSVWGQVKGADWAHPRGPGSDVKAKQDHPVTCVSWHDALAFCRWAGVRLPSEAEWEKAARGPAGRIWPWGDSPPDERRCNFDMEIGDTTPVGCYPEGASPYGVLDMAGNTWEWTSSLWGKGWERPDYRYPYDPADGRENRDAPDSVRRVWRGGSFGSVAQGVRCACRYRSLPDDRLDNIGFRVASPGL